MRATSDRAWLIRVAVVMLLVSALLVGALSAMLPPLQGSAAAFDDDDEGGELEEDDEDENRGGGNDEDGDDEGNPGRGKDKEDKDDKDKDDEEDDEGDYVTAVPTETPEQRAEPTRPALTPVGSPTRQATRTATTGTLVIRLQLCPAGTAATLGATLLAERCTDGQADAVFELTGRSGIYNGWRRGATTGADGTVEVAKLAEGTYHLTLEGLDWCAAEASSVSDGLLSIEPGRTTDVTAYLCDDSGDTAASGS